MNKNQTKEKAKKILSRKIKEFRYERNLSQRDLAMMTNNAITQGDISMYENCKILPLLCRLKVLTKAMKTTPEKLLGRSVSACYDKNYKTFREKKLNLFQKVLKFFGLIK